MLLAQTLVLVAGASTAWGVAAAVGPGIFSDHLAAAEVEQTAAETTHVEEAFASATVYAVTVALAVSLVIALVVTWFFTHRVKRSVDAVADSATRIAHGDYRVRISPPGLGPEFDLLGTSINQLAGRLEKVEQTRRRMLADLAHEMRTPLATIDAHLEAIEDGVRSADADTIAVLRSSTERLGRLGRDISAVSKAEEGQLPIDPRPVRVAELVRTAISAAAHAAESRSVRLVERTASQSVEIMADPERMAQVLANLLDNAIRHSPAGRDVVLSSRRIDRRWVEVSVADAGDGIAAEHLGHVFDRFYRADTARNRQEGGSGIGLAISRALVEAHGGDIVATSPGPGAGATFTMRLPALRGSSTQSSWKAGVDHHLAPGRWVRTTHQPEGPHAHTTRRTPCRRPHRRDRRRHLGRRRAHPRLLLPRDFFDGSAGRADLGAGGPGRGPASSSRLAGP